MISIIEVKLFADDVKLYLQIVNDDATVSAQQQRVYESP